MLTTIETLLHQRPDGSAQPEIVPEGAPTVTIDRALGHLFEEFGPNYQGIADFYNALPHPDKPPLADLHIHFSASTLFDKYDEADDKPVRYIHFSGHHLKDGLAGGSRYGDTTPELAQKTTGRTIVIYVGSILHQVATTGLGTQEEVLSTINAYLAHELVHFAQPPKEEMPEVATYKRQQDKRARLRHAAWRIPIFAARTILGMDADRMWVRTGAAAAAGMELMSAGNPVRALAAGAVVAGLVHATGIKERAAWRAQKTEQAKQEPDYIAYRDSQEFEYYHNNPREVEARLYESTPIQLVEARLRPDWLLSDLESIRLSLKGNHTPEVEAANEAHRQLALAQRKVGLRV